MMTSARAPLSSRAKRGIRAFAVALLLAAPVAAQQVDSLEARRINAARLWATGDRAGARREYEALAQIFVARSDLLTSKQMATIAEAITWLGVQEPQLFRDAIVA